jgi:hypothetical protein
MGTGGSDGWRRLHVRKELGRDRSLGLRTALRFWPTPTTPDPHTSASTSTHTHILDGNTTPIVVYIPVQRQAPSAPAARHVCRSPLTTTLPPPHVTPHVTQHPSLASPIAAGSLNMATVDSAAGEYGHGGTGDRLARAVIIVAGVCSLVASLITFVCVSSLIHPHPHSQC